MEPIIKVSYKEIAEYVYRDERQRAEHIKFMTMYNWEVGHKKRKLKPSVSLMNATDDDYDWYAEFYRSNV